MTKQLEELENLLKNVKHSPYFIQPCKNSDQYYGTYKGRHFFADTMEEVEILILLYVRANTRIL